MRFSHKAIWWLPGLTLAALLVPGPTGTVLAAPPAAAKSGVKADVAAVLKQATDAYKKMKSYQHTAVVTAEGKDETGKLQKQTVRYLLALERPNKFVYKNSGPSGISQVAVAVSDGKTFTNFRDTNDGVPPRYTKGAAPADFKGINIVDDVVFEPLATYVIALMLQGDPLADKDVRAAMEKATLKPGIVTENGRKWQIVSFNFGDREPTDLYFNAEDHLIGKAVQKIPEAAITLTETYENVVINKPIETSVFQYTPPANAKRIDKFPPTAPPLPVQRPGDARNTPLRHAAPTLATR